MAEQLGEAFDLPQLVRHSRARLAVGIRDSERAQKVALDRNHARFFAIVFRRRKLEESRARRFQAAFTGGVAAQMPVARRGEKMRALEFAAEHFSDRLQCFGGREIFRHVPRRVAPDARDMAALAQLHDAPVKIAQFARGVRRLAERDLYK